MIIVREKKEKYIPPKSIMVSEIQDVTGFTQQIANECVSNFMVSIAGRWVKITTETYNVKDKILSYLKERKFQF